jgi:hypothetical protein
MVIENCYSLLRSAGDGVVVMNGATQSVMSVDQTEMERVSEGAQGNAQARSRWLRRLMTWHWISSALALFGMLLFAFTGITLNHAGQIPATPVVETVEARLPPELIKSLSSRTDASPADLPGDLRRWLGKEGIGLGNAQPEWSDYELYVSLPRPGGDAWLSVDFESGELLYESTDRGWISYLNDLHKGRNTGTAWSWFIDLFAVLCIVFCLTGLGVLYLHARERISVWPITGLGVMVPLLLAILLVH